MRRRANGTLLDAQAAKQRAMIFNLDFPRNLTCQIEIRDAAQDYSVVEVKRFFTVCPVA
ncbi:hypothetical protein GGI1_06752 [Acidithiobacillus sp. GGI-221]|jgi:hypothetical protein|nr:hypothetical protein GGI1_06752 [Acidithiobacillus sp. GGI-221]